MAGESYYERTNRNYRDHWTPQRNDSRDSRTESEQGKSAEEYLRTLIEAEILSQQAFAEILTPIRDGFRKSEMTEEQLDALFQEARKKVHQEEQTKKE